MQIGQTGAYPASSYVKRALNSMNKYANQLNYVPGTL